MLVFFILLYWEPTFMNLTLPTPRIALVTGATRGISLETCRQLAKARVHVLLAGRQAAQA